MCPSDANGVYTLPNGSEAVTGETIQAATHNTPIEDLASAMSARLMRSGAAPMTGAFKITDGSVGSPAVQFNSNGSTGFYKTPNGIGISIGGTKVAEFTSSGVARMLGELMPWPLLAVPSGWVLPYGQTLSRTTYAALWEVVQDEIAGGNIFFNNGDGSTTFGIGDLRGRVVAGRDSMGGTDANRLTTTTMTAGAVGGTGGAQTVTLTTTQIPSHTHSNSLSDPGHSHIVSGGVLGGTNHSQLQNSAGSDAVISAATIGINTNTTGITLTNAAAGGGAAHSNVQPTIICNYILYTGV